MAPKGKYDYFSATLLNLLRNSRSSVCNKRVRYGVGCAIATPLLFSAHRYSLGSQKPAKPHWKPSDKLEEDWEIEDQHPSNHSCTSLPVESSQFTFNYPVQKAQYGCTHIKKQTHCPNSSSEWLTGLQRSLFGMFSSLTVNAAEENIPAEKNEPVSRAKDSSIVLS